jgi:hypothetical protein
MPQAGARKGEGAAAVKRQQQQSSPDKHFRCMSGREWWKGGEIPQLQ